jgi:hypothetical protein
MTLSLFDSLPSTDGQAPAEQSAAHLNPIVKREALRLIERGGNGQTGIFDLEQDVVWVRESQAAVRLAHGGRVITDAGTFGDRQLYLDCISSSLDHYAQTIRDFGVTRSSTLEVGIYLTLTDVPHVVSRGAQGAVCLKPLESNRWYVAEPKSSGRGMPLCARAPMKDNRVLCSLTHLRYREQAEASLLGLVGQLRSLVGVTGVSCRLSDDLARVLTAL